MQYLRTFLATDWEKESDGLFHRLFGSIGTSNPSYRGKYHLIRAWLIEFDEAGNPWREIGIGADAAIVVAGPSATDYGFWLDTNMTFADFTGEPLLQEEFDSAWAASGVTCPSST